MSRLRRGKDWHAKILFSIIFGGVLVAIQAWYWAWPDPFSSRAEHLVAAVVTVAASCIAVIFLVFVWHEEDV